VPKTDSVVPRLENTIIHLPLTVLGPAPAAHIRLNLENTKTENRMIHPELIAVYPGFRAKERFERGKAI